MWCCMMHESGRSVATEGWQRQRWCCGALRCWRFTCLHILHSVAWISDDFSGEVVQKLPKDFDGLSSYFPLDFHLFLLLQAYGILLVFA